jgi:hypothetical protein
MATPSDGDLRLRVLASPEPWEALLLPVDCFPMSHAVLLQAQTVLRWFSSEIADRKKLTTEVFLQFWRLRKGDAAVRYSSNAAKWRSDLGLGIWPDRKPPAMWTQETFMDACAGDEPPVLMHKLFRVTAPGKARVAREVMLGCGTVLETMIRGDAAAMLSRAKEPLTKDIKETSFQSFHFYLPLLEAKTVGASTAAQLESWMAGTELYIRESIEDEGILIVSSEPLSPVLKKVGRLEQPQSGPEWRISLS